jgi:chemotaxis protein MotB
MSDGDEEGGHHNSVIIVHRHGDHEEGHHGGAWKIAFADFMTALMAFFLVMWLINSADEQTLSQVASYFNPIKLTDRVKTERGLNDAEHGSGGKEKEKQKALKKEGKHFVNTKTQPGEKRFPEEQLFSDPYDVLARLALMANKIPPRKGGGEDPEGYVGGEAFRDPFDPEFRSEPEDGPVTNGDPKIRKGYEGTPDGTETTPQKSRKTSLAADHQQGPKDAVHIFQKGNLPEPRGNTLGKENVKPEGMAPDKTKSENGPKLKQETHKLTKVVKQKDEQEKFSAEAKIKHLKPPHQGASEKEMLQAQPKTSYWENKIYEQEKIKESAKNISLAFKKEVNKAYLIDVPGISVQATPEGVLISLTDKMNFEMFAISSAEPRPETVVVMEKLAKILKKQKGQIVIRGFTDSRVYRSKKYDNWRLSASRAHMSYYMLVRAGIPKRRVDHIEGYADHKPRNPRNTRAAENRRIEILLKPEKT